MIIIICEDANNSTGWGTYSNQYAKVVNSFEDTIIICHKKNKKLNIKQFDLLSSSKEYSSKPFKIFTDALKINKIINKINQKITLHFIVETYALLIPFLKKSLIKIFLTFHGSFFFHLTIREKFILRFLFKKAIKFSNKIIYVSDYTKNKINPKLQKISKKETIVIPNGINFIERKILKKRDKTLNILCLSAFKKRKGQLNLIKSIKLLEKKFKKFKVTLAGRVYEKMYFKEIKSEISGLKFKNKFKIKCFVNEKEKHKLFRNSDLFVLLSEDYNNNFEGFGLVYLEALSYGLPVIVSNQCGFSEAIFKHHTGIVVNPKDYRTISNFIFSISKKNLTKISKQCVEVAKQNDWKKKINKIKNLYN